MVLALQKDNAVESWRKTIGATNPEDADENTIRRDFATNVQENAVHGSDSDENAEKEIAFFFSDGELLSDQWFSFMRKIIHILPLLHLFFACDGSGIEGYVNEPITITANNPEEGQDVDIFGHFRNNQMDL